LYEQISIIGVRDPFQQTDDRRPDMPALIADGSLIMAGEDLSQGVPVAEVQITQQCFILKGAQGGIHLLSFLGAGEGSQCRLEGFD
jgi:hypothetical protein